MISYSATAIIIQDGSVLLIKRASKPFKGYWALIGGKKEENESYEECAMREAKEEACINITDVRFFGGIRVKNAYGLQFSLLFTARPSIFQRGYLCAQEGEVFQTKWYPIDALPEHIVPIHKTLLEDYKEYVYNKKEGRNNVN